MLSTKIGKDFICLWMGSSLSYGGKLWLLSCGHVYNELLNFKRQENFGSNCSCGNWRKSF